MNKLTDYAKLAHECDRLNAVKSQGGKTARASQVIHIIKLLPDRFVEIAF